MTPFKTFQNLSPVKQQQITRIAIDEFSEKGYTGASINSIVKRLGIAKGSIFQYFGDKNGLFLFIFNTSIDKVKDYLRKVRDQTVEDDLFTRLEKTLTAGVLFIRKHPLIYKFYLKILYEFQIPYRDKMLLSLRAYSLEYIRSLLETAQQRGEIKADMDLDKTSFIIDAVMDRFLQARTTPHWDAGLGIYQADDNEIQQWIHDLTDMIRTGIRWS